MKNKSSQPKVGRKNSTIKVYYFLFGILLTLGWIRRELTFWFTEKHRMLMLNPKQVKRLWGTVSYRDVDILCTGTCILVHKYMACALEMVRWKRFLDDFPTDNVLRSTFPWRVPSILGGEIPTIFRLPRAFSEAQNMYFPTCGELKTPFLNVSEQGGSAEKNKKNKKSEFFLLRSGFFYFRRIAYHRATGYATVITKNVRPYPRRIISLVTL